MKEECHLLVKHAVDELHMDKNEIEIWNVKYLDNETIFSCNVWPCNLCLGCLNNIFIVFEGLFQCPNIKIFQSLLVAFKCFKCRRPNGSYSNHCTADVKIKFLLPKMQTVYTWMCLFSLSLLALIICECRD